MKTFRLLLAVSVVALFSYSNTSGQNIKQEMVITVDEFDYGPGIGIVDGSYTYLMNINLSKDGKLQRLNWHVSSCDLENENGDKVKVVDSGMDNLGIMWVVLNTLNALNIEYGAPNVYNDLGDGWLTTIVEWPDPMPVEGTTANMSAKIICKGTTVRIGFLVQLHMDANGNIRAEVLK
jgi:hypothetical protein